MGVASLHKSMGVASLCRSVGSVSLYCCEVNRSCRPLQVNRCCFPVQVHGCCIPVLVKEGEPGSWRRRHRVPGHNVDARMRTERDASCAARPETFLLAILQIHRLHFLRRVTRMDSGVH